MILTNSDYKQQVTNLKRWNSNSGVDTRKNKEGCVVGQEELEYKDKIRIRK